MLYGAPQSGPSPVSGLNLTSVCPGDSITLFDGTETPVQGMKSVAFSRGVSGTADRGTSFFASGMPAGSVLSVQAANQDLDGSYFTLYASAPDANGNFAYTDDGRAAYYRVVLSTYVSGAMPVVIAKR